MGIKEEITKIAVEQGYEGAKPKSIAQAIDALTDTLAGEDVKSGRSVVDAIRKYAPYVGSGGGTKRVKLFNETVTTEDDGGWAKAILSFTGDITDDPLVVVFDGTEYELPRSEAEGLMGKTVTYGTPLTEDGPDFSTYPLAIKSGPNAGEWRVYTKTAGTYTVIAYTDGSGGGGSLGALQAMPMTTNSKPRVGQVLDSPSPLEVVETRVGSQVVFRNPIDNIVFMYTVAAGATVVACDSQARRTKGVSAYLATGTESDGDITIETLEDFDLDVSVDSDRGVISFVMPEWNAEEGQFPIMHIERKVG